jgi:hypothetical protein
MGIGLALIVPLLKELGEFLLPTIRQVTLFKLFPNISQKILFVYHNDKAMVFVKE